MTHPFFTIGHSTRPIEEFVDLLKLVKVRLVVDVRAVPQSRKNPQYNHDALPQTLSEFQMGYVHVAALGGLRGISKDVSPLVNSLWENQSFHNYADYTLTAAFRSGFATLRKLGHARPCAVMCAETVWWRCHRRIISDYLIAAGETVFHIVGKNRIQPALMTDGAEADPKGSLKYPARL
jgi:uncharacterized protein (DUF488 family)